MRILIYGECDEYGSGSWCYYQTLKDMGHEVAYFSQFNGVEKYYRSLPYKIIRKLKNGGVFKWSRSKHNKSFINACEDFTPQIILVLKGLLIEKKTIAELKNRGSWVVLVNHDDFFSEFKSSRSEIQFNAISEYDFIFCTKEINVNEIKPINPHTEFFQFAYYPKIHHPPVFDLRDQKKWNSDFVFVGNCYPERVRQLEYLVANLKKETDLKIYGPNWHQVKRQSPLIKYLQNKTLSPEEMSKAIFYSKISLGFLCKENRDDYTQRTFEIPAIKGLLFAERTERHVKLLAENLEAVYFDSSDYDDLVRKAEMLLTKEEFRESVRSEGNIRIIRDHHTYEDRLKRIFELYNLHGHFQS